MFELAPRTHRCRGRPRFPTVHGTEGGDQAQCHNGSGPQSPIALADLPVWRCAFEWLQLRLRWKVGLHCGSVGFGDGLAHSAGLAIGASRVRSASASALRASTSRLFDSASAAWWAASASASVRAAFAAAAAVSSFASAVFCSASATFCSASAAFWSASAVRCRPSAPSLIAALCHRFRDAISAGSVPRSAASRPHVHRVG